VNCILIEEASQIARAAHCSCCTLLLADTLRVRPSLSDTIFRGPPPRAASRHAIGLVGDVDTLVIEVAAISG
tara:strand:+ start:91852 stop:92067 length:216 start_codon:yes stop_codon:yes gene_type:complete